MEETAWICESLWTYDGVIFRLEEHFKRFLESLKKVGPAL